MTTSTDCIEKTNLLRAPLDRVWRAITDSAEFGTWFGVEFDGPFEPGAQVDGRVVPTKVDPEIARHQEAYTGIPFVVHVDVVEPMTRFVFRWCPLFEDEAVGELASVLATVTFALAEEEEGVRLTITEAGFDAIPDDALRALASSRNEGGWEGQCALVDQYLDGGTA